MSQRPDSGALIRAMLTLRGEHKSGVLRVDAEGIRTLVYLLEGTPMFADEGTAGETLGRLLVRQGTITQEQCNAILVKMTEALFDDEQLRFGEVAVELGILTGDQVQRALTDQARSKIAAMLQRESPEWIFDEGRGALAEVGRFPMRIEGVALLAARSLSKERRAAILDPEARRYLVLGVDAETATRRFELTSAESDWVAGIDGRATVAELAGASPGASVDPPAILVALLQTGVATLSDTPPPPRPAGAQPRGTMPSNANPSAAILPNAAVAGKGAIDSKTRAEHVQQVLARVRTGSAEAKPAGAPRTAHEARLKAELAFQRGKTHFKNQRVGPALEDFQTAADLEPDREEYQLFFHWTSVVVRKQPPTDGERLLLKRLAFGVSRRDPTMAFAPYVIGRLAVWENNDAEASKWLERALGLDAGLTEAKQELDAVIARRPSQLGKVRAKLASLTELIGAPGQGAAKGEPQPVPVSHPPPGAFVPPPAHVSLPPLTVRPARPPVPWRKVGAVAGGFVVVVVVALVLGRRAMRPQVVAAPVRSPIVSPSPVLVFAPTSPPSASPAAPSASASAAPSVPSAAPAPPPSSAPSAAPAPPPSSLASATPAPAAAPLPVPSATAPAPPASASPAAAIDPARGLVHLPASAGGHRVFVDGKNVAITGGALSVKCGSHTIRIGSNGKERTVNVPCGGEVALE